MCGRSSWCRAGLSGPGPRAPAPSVAGPRDPVTCARILESLHQPESLTVSSMLPSRALALQGAFPPSYHGATLSLNLVSLSSHGIWGAQVG